MYQGQLDLPLLSGEQPLLEDLEKEFHLITGDFTLGDKMERMKKYWILPKNFISLLGVFFLRKYHVNLWESLPKETGLVSGRKFLIYEGVRYEIVMKLQGDSFQTENVLLSFRKLKNYPIGVVLVKDFWE